MMMKKYNILLATTFEYHLSKSLCISNYKYISKVAKIEYNHNMLYNTKDLLCAEHETVICMNHFSVFTSTNLSNILALLTDTTNIVLPANIGCPLETIPLCFRNCAWSRQFLSNYILSGIYNLKKFISTLSYADTDHIKQTNLIHNDSSKPKNRLIHQYMHLPTESMLESIKSNNMLLGIL